MVLRSTSGIVGLLHDSVVKGYDDRTVLRCVHLARICNEVMQVGLAQRNPARAGNTGSIGSHTAQCAALIAPNAGYRGLAGAFIDEQRLYLRSHLGAEPYHYEKRREEAEAIIKSGRII